MKLSTLFVVISILLSVGLVKSESIQLAAQSNLCEGLKDDTLLPDPKSCTKYIKCDDGKEKSKSCDLLQGFDVYKKKCVSLSQANCVGATTTTPLPTTEKVTTTEATTTTEEVTTAAPTTTTAAPTTTTAAPKTTTKKTTTAAPPNLCAGLKDDTLLPDPKSCTKYIKCDDGKEKSKSCGLLQGFDVYKKKCVSLSQANCVGATTTTPLPTTEKVTTTEATTTTEEVTTAAPTTTTAAPKTTTKKTTTAAPPNLCAGLKDDTLLPDPKSCTKYIKCDDGKEKSKSCGLLQGFDVYKMKCVSLSQANCVGATTTTPLPTTEKVTTTEATTTTEEVTTAAPTTTTAAPTTTTAAPKTTTKKTTTAAPPNLCAGLKDDTLLPDPKSCTKYIKCDDGKEKSKSCGLLQGFDVYKMKCVSLSQANCVGVTTTTPLPTTEKVTTTTEKATTTKRTTTEKPTTTERTTTEKATTTERTTTEKATTLPPPTTEKSTTTIATVTEPTTVECPPSVVVMKPLPGSCSEFILCFDGTPVVQQCADGLHFSAEYKNCVPIEIANCIAGLKCPADDDLENIVKHPNSENCSSYYICMNGEKVPMSCGPDLHFNAAINKCDYAENTKCKTKVVPRFMRNLFG